MKNKYIYEQGERKQNPKCNCPLKDKSKCFKIFCIRKDTDRFGKMGEFAGWGIDCPHYNEQSKLAMRMFNRLMTKVE